MSPPSPSVDPLTTYDRSGFAVATMTWSWEPPSLRRTVIVKSTFSLGAAGEEPLLSDEQAPLDVDTHASTDDEPELLRATDYVPLKPQVDVLVRGTAHAPPGRSAALLRIEVGSIENEMVGFGERRWTAYGIPGAAGPFEPFPLQWSRAAGGADQPANPAGISEVPPRLENPRDLVRDRTHLPRPSGWSPISPQWESRRALLGTFDAAWLDAQWPYLPRDLDLAFFQAAPEHMRSTAVAPGSRFSVTGVRPDGQGIHGRLPTPRPRAFAALGSGEPAEVDLTVDTLLFDTDALHLSMVWRGSYEVTRDARVRQKELLFVLRDDASSPIDDRTIGARIAAMRGGDWTEATPLLPFADRPVRPIDQRKTLQRTPRGAFVASPTVRPKDPPEPISRAELERKVLAETRYPAWTSPRAIWRTSTSAMSTLPMRS